MKMKIATTVLCLLISGLFGLSIMAVEESTTNLVDMAPDEMPTHVVKVLRTTNKAQINSYVAKVYDFKNVNPNQIANFIANGLELEEGGIYTFVHPDGDKGKMLVICPKYQLPWIDKVCADLDRPQLTSAPGSKYIYYRLKHRNAADPDFLAVLGNYISANGIVWPDIETNSVLLFDSPSGADYAAKALDEYLDSPTPQVNIDVCIYEIDLKNDGTLGLDYEMWKNGPGAALFAAQITGKYVTSRYNNVAFGPPPPFMNTLPPVLGGNLPKNFRYRDWYRGYGYRLEYPSSFFDFLVEKGKARILVDTKVSACNASQAMICSNEFISYFRTYHAQVGSGYTAVLSESPPIVSGYDTGDVGFVRTVNSAQAPLSVEGLPHLGIDMVESGISLEVTPIIGQEDINLELVAKVSNHIGWASNGEPLLKSFQINNEFRVKNNEQILIGGLTRERLIKSAKKIPILGDLPVIGWVFGGETDYLQKSILVVALTPSIITDFSGKTAVDDNIMAKATGKTPVKIPSVKVGFDQYLLDGAK